VKKLTLIFFILILVSSVFWGTIASGVTQTPHENPSTAESHFNIAIPLLHYGEIFNQIADRNTLEARTLLGQLRPMEYAQLPEAVAFIMMRYSDLITDLTKSLDNLDSILDTCEQLLSQNELSEASLKLGEAKELVSQATELIETISMATEELILQVAPFVSPQEAAAVNEAKARLQTAMERLAELEMWYRDRLKNLDLEAEEKKDLLATKLTLNVNPAQVWVGGQLTLSGELKATDTSLPARDISIFLDGRHFATVTTVEYGSYEANLTLPYWYVPEVSAQTFYLPKANDRSTFTASSSEIKRIDVLFHPTKLSIKIPGKVYPGLPVEISGRISSRGNIVGRNIKVSLDGEPLFEAATDSYGLFEHQVMLTKETRAGEHKLRFVVAPDNESRSAGTLIDRSLHVVKIAPQIRICAPRAIVLPQIVELTGELYPPLSLQGAVSLTGEIHSPLSLQGAALTLNMAGVSTTIIIDEGEFELGLDLPFKFNIVGYEDMEVSLAPAEPWHLPTISKVSIFVVNLAYLAIILAALILAGVVFLVKGVRILRRKKSFFALPEKLQTPVSATEFYLPEFKPASGDNKGIILQAYYMTVAAVQKLAQILLKPQMTLREFLSQVTSSLGSFAGLFAKLTGLAEKALYSRYTLGKEEASLAQNLASQVKQEGISKSKS
jgi:hypothetical protein